MSAENNAKKSRIWTCAIAGIIAVILIIASAPRHSFSPKGILLPTKTHLAPTEASNVTLLPTPVAITYQNLGAVHIEMHYPEKSKMAERQIIYFARKMAAKRGANAIIVKIFGHTGAGVPSGLAIYSFQGTAIYSKAIASRRLSILTQPLLGAAYDY